MRMLRAALMTLISLAAAQASDIEGNVVVKRRLTRRTVTTAANSYQRGISVEPGPGRDQDPLASERARVVIYLEGELRSTPVTATLEQKNGRFVPDTQVIS